ncbi:MAG TPA: TolC family protein [Candidatus Aminicenantes bacterium]|nr:TolC family protein [Candidatus Aminicenantes bacterium]
MRNRIVLGLVAFALALQAGYSREYKLDDFIEAVRENSKVLRLAAKQKETAREQKREARAGAFPQIGIEIGYTRNLSDYYMYFDLSSLLGGPPIVSKVPIKRDNELIATLGVNQTLFNASVLYAVKASRRYEALVEEVYQANEQAVINNAKKLFYQGILLDKVVDVAHKSEQNARENFRDVKLKYEQGQVSEFELLRAETRWRAAIPEVLQAERNRDLLINNLKNLAGIDPDVRVVLDGTLEGVPVFPEVVGIERALSARPDYNVLLNQEKLAGTGVRAARGSYLPVVKARAAFAYSSQSDAFKLEEENKLWMVGINLSLPVFTGGYRKAQVNKAKIELDKVRIRMQRMRDDVRTELNDVYLKLDEARQRMESTQSTLNVARKAFQIAEVTTRNGLTTQLDLKDARVALDRAALGSCMAHYDYLAAYFDWETATGLDQQLSFTFQ